LVALGYVESDLAFPQREHRPPGHLRIQEKRESPSCQSVFNQNQLEGVPLEKKCIKTSGFGDV
jgi:hypothetical protein